jgi:hypothetical protein
LIIEGIFVYVLSSCLECTGSALDGRNIVIVLYFWLTLFSAQGRSVSYYCTDVFLFMFLVSCLGAKCARWEECVCCILVGLPFECASALDSRSLLMIADVWLFECASAARRSSVL